MPIRRCLIPAILCLMICDGASAQEKFVIEEVRSERVGNRYDIKMKWERKSLVEAGGKLTMPLHCTEELTGIREIRQVDEAGVPTRVNVTVTGSAAVTNLVLENGDAQTHEREPFKEGSVITYMKTKEGKLTTLLNGLPQTSSDELVVSWMLSLNPNLQAVMHTDAPRAIGESWQLPLNSERLPIFARLLGADEEFAKQELQQTRSKIESGEGSFTAEAKLVDVVSIGEAKCLKLTFNHQLREGKDDTTKLEGKAIQYLPLDATAVVPRVTYLRSLTLPIRDEKDKIEAISRDEYSINIELQSRNDPPLRTWTDASGKFNVDARFVSVADSIVELADFDGRKILVDLSKLSETDRQYVKSFEK